MNLLEAQRAVFASALGPNDKLTALALLDHWSRSRETYPSVKRLCDWTSLSRCSVMRAIGALEAAGVVVVARTNGRANRYELGALTGLPQRPVSHSDRSPTATQPVSGGDGTSLPQRLDRSPGETRSDPVRDPGSNPGKEDRSPTATGLPQRPVYRTDGAGTRLVDPLAATFAPTGHVELHAFEAWAKAFEKTGATFDTGRAACLAERVGTGMTTVDADDAIAGALTDDYVTGKKDGRRHDRLSFIFGDAERYEEFRDRGRKLRAAKLRKVASSQGDEEYKSRIRAEAEAHHAAAAAGVQNGGSATVHISVAALTEGIGGC